MRTVTKLAQINSQHPAMVDLYDLRIDLFLQKMNLPGNLTIRVFIF